MPYIKADNPQEQAMFDYLEELRKSGDTNMFGASPYLQHAFGLKKEKAVAVLSKWMKLHSDPARRMEKPATKQKAHRQVTRFETDEEARHD